MKKKTEKQLVRREFNKICKGLKLPCKVKLRIYNNSVKWTYIAINGYENFLDNGSSFIIKKAILHYDINTFHDVRKNGVGDNSYKIREKKIKFLIGNKKLTRKFILLHEIGHVFSFDSVYKIKLREIRADNWALNYLKNEK